MYCILALHDHPDFRLCNYSKRKKNKPASKRHEFTVSQQSPKTSPFVSFTRDPSSLNHCETSTAYSSTTLLLPLLKKKKKTQLKYLLVARKKKVIIIIIQKSTTIKKSGLYIWLATFIKLSSFFAFKFANTLEKEEGKAKKKKENYCYQNRKKRSQRSKKREEQTHINPL